MSLEIVRQISDTTLVGSLKNCIIWAKAYHENKVPPTHPNVISNYSNIDELLEEVEFRLNTYKEDPIALALTAMLDELP